MVTQHVGKQRRWQRDSSRGLCLDNTASGSSIRSPLP